MVILQIFNRYQYYGGEEASVLRVAGTLERQHKVVRCYFESKTWLEENESLAPLKHAFKMVYNRDAIKRVSDLIHSEKPDLILIHNMFPVCSAAMLWKLVRSGIPVVQYVHNFRPFSVNGYCWANGKVCDSGFKLNYLPEILSGSWQGSRLKTAWYASILWMLHASGSYKKISGWIAISSFMKERFVEAGIDERLITVIRHSWNAMEKVPVEEIASQAREAPYFLFLGRLTQEKGIHALVEAWALTKEKLAESGIPASLVIGGDGPLSDWLEEQTAEIDGLEYVGQVSGDRKDELLAGCIAMVAPSIWWEPLGLVVYEAYDYEKPVLAAASGGLRETVHHEQTGLLHQPGDCDALSEHMVRLLRDSEQASEYGRNGRKMLLDTTSPEKWESLINDVFEGIIESNSTAAQDAGSARAVEAIRVLAYLADQNPKLGRSLGISRMTEVVLAAIAERQDVELWGIASRSSIQMPEQTRSMMIPWSTRGRASRVLTDHLHPMLRLRMVPDLWYFPKGFLPRVGELRRPTVVTIHDTILQYYSDQYPKWRTDVEYHYWASVLKNTLRRATAILTVSESAKTQISEFMERHGLSPKEIIVTYEPCLYEMIDQPDCPAKADYVLHLASREPHKRTSWLIELWDREHAKGRVLPQLHVVGKVPYEIAGLARQCPAVVQLPFLDDDALVSQFKAAGALLLPSEIEGFGLPAIEAYYLGTPVCYVKGTSVEEILAVATSKGGFHYDEEDSIFGALDEVMGLSPEEVRECGLKLRREYAADRVVDRILEVFKQVGGKC